MSAAALLLILPLIEGGSEAGEAFPGHLHVAGNADPEVLRAFEEASGHYAGLVVRAQEAAELLHISVAQPGKRGGSYGRNDEVDRGMAAQGCGERAAIGFEDGIGTGSDFVELFDGDDAQQVGDVRRACGEEVIEVPDTLGELRFGDDPSAAEAA